MTRERPIRVTHVLAPVAFGGGEALLSNLIAAKRSDLIESVITVGRAPLFAKQLGRSATELRALGCAEVGPQRGGKVPELLAVLPLLPGLRSALADLRPDVIHTHGFPPSLLGALPLPAHIGRVYTHHYERQCPGVVERHCLTGLFNRYDALTAVADHLSVSMNLLFPQVRRPFETLPIAVRDEFFDATPSGILRGSFPADTAIGICVGRLVASKNQRLVLESLAELKPEVRARIGIVLVGHGPDEPLLQQLAAQLGVASQIRFLGHITAESMPSLLADADFGVFPTITEASSVAAAEALAAGLPLLSLDIASMRETAAAAGTYAPPERFADGMRRIACTHAAAVPAARAAAERFRIATVRDRWAAVYRRVNNER